MKVNVEVECTPQEARSFLGLPDVEPLNSFIIDQMKERVAQNIHSMQPDEIMKNWSSYGMQAQDQFMKLMQSAASAGLNSFGTMPK